jgi:hypothetical protein
VLLPIAMLSMAYVVPKGWIKGGNKLKEYDMGINEGKGMNGNDAATIASISDKINGFGTLMQNIDPEKYKGKRLRLSGYMKAERVSNWAGFWMRVDGTVAAKTIKTTVKNKQNGSLFESNEQNTDERKTLAFDNMFNRSLSGTENWKKCEIVLDVADSATNIAFGALLAGTGQIWFDEIHFDIVGNDVNVTGLKNKEPMNLEFKK